jgi:hypothetical protein
MGSFLEYKIDQILHVQNLQGKVIDAILNNQREQDKKLEKILKLLGNIADRRDEADQKAEQKTAANMFARRQQPIEVVLYDIFTKDPHCFDSIIGKDGLNKMQKEVDRIWATSVDNEQRYAIFQLYYRYMFEKHEDALNKMFYDHCK